MSTHTIVSIFMSRCCSYVEPSVRALCWGSMQAALPTATTVLFLARDKGVMRPDDALFFVNRTAPSSRWLHNKRRASTQLFCWSSRLIGIPLCNTMAVEAYGFDSKRNDFPQTWPYEYAAC